MDLFRRSHYDEEQIRETWPFLIQDPLFYDYLVDDEAKAFLQERARDIEFEYIYYDWNLNR